MKKFLILAPFVALTFACSGGGGKLQPGNYELTTKVTNFEVPGAPAGLAEQMKKEQKQTQCLTQAEIDNFGSKMAESSAQGANCNFTKTAFGSGTIDVAGTCSGGGGEQATVTMTGSNTTDSFTATTNIEASQGGQQMKMTAETSARRIGDCSNQGK